MIRHHSSVCRCGITDLIVLTNAPGNINPTGEGWGRVRGALPAKTGGDFIRMSIPTFLGSRHLILWFCRRRDWLQDSPWLSVPRHMHRGIG